MNMIKICYFSNIILRTVCLKKIYMYTICKNRYIPGSIGIYTPLQHLLLLYRFSRKKIFYIFHGVEQNWRERSMYTFSGECVNLIKLEEKCVY